MNKFILILSTLFILGCSKEDSSKVKPNTYFNDFESSIGWVQYQDAITSEKASSGKYATFVSPQNPYSSTFSAKFSKLQTIKPKKVVASAKVFVQDLEGLNTNFNVNIKGKRDSSEVKSLFYNGSNLKSKNVVIGSWQDVSFDIGIPDVLPDDEIIICFWSEGAKFKTYIDDIKLLIE